ncbi:ATP-binding protein [Pseudochelatococcus contaminans]|uniref:histidine kinase n=1 Tax=Pseudochelatococcus contaminans TaxID=1538103 RepID=A0A7W5Z4M2_9HYPH|nr:signal transduction histidine kinase [Pseudochelatococcus contaminans]
MRERSTGLPVAVRLPVIAAAMIFFVAVASTQTAIFFMGRQTDRQVETFGQIYLDGLSASLLPHATANDGSSIRATLERALMFHEGIIDRRLTFIDSRAGTVIEAMRPEINAAETVPVDVLADGNGFSRSDDGTIWIWRQLTGSEGKRLGTILANLDISSFEDERSSIRWLLLIIDLVFSGACAIIGFFMVRRMQRPMATVAQHLYDAALGMPRPIALQEIPGDDVQAERMMHAFNALAHAASERESLLAHLADQQREADLGRLTATIAHEVRNPLGGMRTAISTLKRFGDRDQPRGEAVEFLERGIVALEHVVDATLENYRARPEWRPLSRQDFEDLHLLVEADGRSREVAVALNIHMHETVAVAALEVRQVVLNLLLNAVRASSKGDTVTLDARIHEDELVVTVEDQGSGLDCGIAHAMESGVIETDGPGLGVAVIIRLVERLQGHVAIASTPNQGTRITLHFPLQDRRTNT